MTPTIRQRLRNRAARKEARRLGDLGVTQRIRTEVRGDRIPFGPRWH